MDLMKDLKQIINDNKDKPTVNVETTTDTQNNLPQKDSTQAYESARAAAEVQATKEIVANPTTAVKVKISERIAKRIDESKEIAAKIDATADRITEKDLQAEENHADAAVTRSENGKSEADFEKNKNEYLYHGIDHKIAEKWKRNLLLGINNFWFVVFAIASFFTIVPISTFMSRVKALKGIVKGFAITLGVLCLIAVICGITYAILRACGVNLFG